MKTINTIAAIILISTFILSGCSNKVFDNKWSSNGLSFQYPDELRVSIDVFKPYMVEPIIFVDQRPITSFIQGCVGFDLLRELGREYELNQKYRSIVEQIRDGEINSDIEKFDSLRCHSAGVNQKVDMLKVNNTNGIIYQKILADEVGSLTVFYTQIILVDKNDLVHSIIIPYIFGKNKEYIDTIRGEYGEAYPEEFGTYEKYGEVRDYFKYGKEITSPELKGFSENGKVISKIIKSISIK